MLPLTVGENGLRPKLHEFAAAQTGIASDFMETCVVRFGIMSLFGARPAPLHILTQAGRQRHAEILCAALVELCDGRGRRKVP